MTQIVTYGYIVDEEQTEAGRFTSNSHIDIDPVIITVDDLLPDYQYIEIAYYDQVGHCDSVFKIERFV